jgi:hypothetical protein
VEGTSRRTRVRSPSGCTAPEGRQGRSRPPDERGAAALLLTLRWMSGSGRGPEHLLDQSGPPEPGIPEDEERTPGLSGSGDDAVPAVSCSPRFRRCSDGTSSFLATYGIHPARVQRGESRRNISAVRPVRVVWRTYSPPRATTAAIVRRLAGIHLLVVGPTRCFAGDASSRDPSPDESDMPHATQHAPDTPARPHGRSHGVSLGSWCRGDRHVRLRTCATTRKR